MKQDGTTKSTTPNQTKLPERGRGMTVNVSVSDTGLFKDIIGFIRLAVEKYPDLEPEFMKVVEKHGRKFAIDRWLED